MSGKESETLEARIHDQQTLDIGDLDAKVGMEPESDIQRLWSADKTTAEDVLIATLEKISKLKLLPESSSSAFWVRLPLINTPTTLYKCQDIEWSSDCFMLLDPSIL